MKTYEYIVVGAGSAGAVVAARLAEADRRVLLLEAGGSEKHVNVSIPAAFAKLFRTERDWNYASGPEPYAENRELYVPRGRMLGGSSSMNAMIYIRGHRQDYDDWAAAGCAGWAYDDVLPYFKRSEHNERGPDAYHGASGPLNVADLRSASSLTQRFVEAAVAAGQTANPDFNGAEQAGFGQYQVTQKGGKRCSTAVAFLRPAMSRSNLTVETGALAHRVLIENGRAVGVEYAKDGTSMQARASGEVILCGGAVNSPQLLMLSGVGPADHLREHGIEVAVDNPNVGDHLQDHPFVLMSWATDVSDSLESAETPRSLLTYLFRKQGLLTSNVGEGGGFVKVLDDEAATDLQFHFAPAFFQDHGFKSSDVPSFTVAPTLVAPKSRGRLSLRSADPTAKPTMVGNHLKEDSDVEILLRGLDLAREIVAATPMAAVNRGALTLPDTVTSRADKEAFIRRHVELIYHPACTARMGPEDTSVVDSELRVYGVDGLRVVDASVMPTISRGNTNAPTIMIAEKASDLILAAA